MRQAGSPPDEASLHNAALAHLARHGTSAANLLRVLDRRIERWAREAEAEPELRSRGSNGGAGGRGAAGLRRRRR